MAADKQDLAEDRTDWAEDRTSLASERTFAGWLRTGLAAVAVAIGLKAVFGEMEPTWIAKGITTLFLGGAVLIFLSARGQAARSRERFKTHDVEVQSTARVTAVVAILTVATIGTGAILWML